MAKRKESKNKDNYKERGCDFINESKCEEELDEDELDLNESEREHFEEKDEEIEY